MRFTDYESTENENLTEYNNLLNQAKSKNAYSYLQLSSWHCANAINVKDYVKAYNYANRAVHHGFYEGYYILGQLLLLGTGCEKNIYKGINYLKRFISKAEGRNVDADALADAYYKLANVYFDTKNYSKALYYYRKLKSVDVELADKLSDFESVIFSNIKENKFNLIKNCTLSLVALGAFVFCVYTYKDNVYNFINAPKKQEISVITNIDVNTVTRDSYTPAKKQDISDFYLISKEAFELKKYEKVLPVTVTSTSEYISCVGTDYSAKCAFDDNINTSWQEGAQGPGIDESIHVEFPNLISLKGIVITNGKAITHDDYLNNNRLKTFVLRGFEEYTIRIEDKEDKQYIFLSKPMELSSLDLVIDSVYQGYIFDDTCITEIEFWQ